MSTELMHHCLRRLADQPLFWGHILAKARTKSGLSFEEHAAELRLSLEDYTRLAWCKAPRETKWRDDINTVARYIHVRVFTLVRLCEENP